MENQEAKKTTPQRNYLIYACIGVLSVGLIAGIFSIVEYRGISDHIQRSGELSDTEDYSGAAKSLERAEDSWLVNLFKIQKSSIDASTEEVKTRILDQQSYLSGLATGNEGDWEKGMNLLSKIPTDSFYYQRSQTTIEQLRVKILEQELGIEQTNRQSAEKEVERQMLALNVVQEALNQETSNRLLAESDTKSALDVAEKERSAKEAIQVVAQFQTERANREESEKIQAQSDALSQEQRANLEQSEKLQAQAEAAAQEQRADLEEKARIQGLALTNPMIQAIVSGELKFYFEPIPTYAGMDVSSGVEDISSSFSSWSPYGATIRRVFSQGDADLTVSWLKDYGTHTIGESIFKAHIKVGMGTDNCHGDWQAFDVTTIKKVLWHEIGHSMGYGHSSDPNNVMYWQTETRFDVEQEIARIVSPSWYSTYPFCGSGSYQYSFESDSAYNDFDIYVLPPDTDASTISTGEGLVYTGCGKANVVQYADTCNNLPSGAVIYIENSSYSDAVRLDGEIILMDQASWPNMDWDETAFQYDDAQLDTYWSLFH
jgi:hypothetical protein